jgi:dephospho-CoA kinase
MYGMYASSEQLQLHRLSIRNSLPTSSALARIKSQKPLSSKMVYADYVIDNSVTLTDLKEQVIRTVRKLKSQSGGWGWWMSWVFPPWGLFFGMATVVWRLTWKGVGREKKRRVTSSKKRDEIAEGRVNAREEVELRQLRRPEVFEPDE